jgi:hypothetical protein
MAIKSISITKPRRFHGINEFEDMTKEYIPFVISFNIEGLAYNEGFKNPIGFLPTFKRSSLMRVMTDEKMGVLAEVPPNELALSPR